MQNNGIFRHLAAVWQFITNRNINPQNGICHGLGPGDHANPREVTLLRGKKGWVDLFGTNFQQVDRDRVLLECNILYFYLHRAVIVFLIKKT